MATQKTKALTNIEAAVPALPGGYTQEEVRLLKQIGGASLDTIGEVRYFLSVADRLRLDPLKRQIYAVKYQGKLTIQTGIDGYRLLAQRTGVFGGSGAPEWYDEEREEWVDVWLSETPPAAARVRVYRVGAVEPFVGIAHWREYVQWTGKGNERRVNSMWTSKPAHMLAKCAEALALRRAFPAEMSGLYTSEETGAWVDEETGEIHPPEDAVAPPEYIDGEVADASTEAEAVPEGPVLYGTQGETVEEILDNVRTLLDGQPMSLIAGVLPPGANFNGRLAAWAEVHPDVPTSAALVGEALEHARQQQMPLED
jgi:phage recombination protein Bet